MTARCVLAAAAVALGGCAAPGDARDTEPRSYPCRRSPAPPRIDGHLGDAAWSVAPWTDDFVDIEGSRRRPPPLRTRARLLWDERALYVAAEMEEPHLWATITRHDAVIFREHDFELFLDPDGDAREYVELEVNALGTTWDLLLPETYRAGGTAIDAFELEGLAVAVALDGTLSDPRDTDRGWTVEIAIPWSALRAVAGTRLPPRAGDVWRLNFSRVAWPLRVEDGRYVKPEGARESNWVWSPQGVVDMHLPERWGRLVFE